MKSGISNLLKIQFIESAPEIAPEIETDSARRLTTKSIKLIHAAHAKATQAIEQHIAPGYEADVLQLQVKLNPVKAFKQKIFNFCSFG